LAESIASARITLRQVTQENQRLVSVADG